MRSCSIKKLAIIIFALFANISVAQQNVQNSNLAITINSKVGEIAMTKEELINATISLQIGMNSNIGSKVLLQGFTFKCPGQKTFVINGEKLTEDAILCIKRARVGDYITLYDPKIKIDGIAKTANGKSVTIELK